MKNIKFFKIIALKILLLATIFNQGVFAKPIPPGSGEGDVPANILFLLDSSDSMDTNIFSGTPMRNAEDIVELNDGNLIIAQKQEGLIKLIYSTTEKDYAFANAGSFLGAVNPDASDAVYGTGNCAEKNSYFQHVIEIAYDKTSDIIYAVEHHPDYYKIVSLNSDGTCVDVIEAGDTIGDDGQVLNFSLRGIDIRNIGGEEHMFVIGYDYDAPKNTRGRLFSKNLTTGVGIVCSGLETKHFDSWARKNDDVAVTSDGSKLYLASKHSIIRYSMSKINTDSDAGTLDNYCPTVGSGGTVTDTSGKGYDVFYDKKKVDFANARAIGLDPDDDNTIYVGDYSDHSVKKFTIGEGDHALTLVKERGTLGTTNVTEDANLVFKRIRGLTIGTVNKSSANNNVLYVGDEKPTVEVLDRVTNNLTWEKEIGGPKIMRLTGAINAIKAVLNDSTLTSGAHFGYGYWNSGVPETGERQCHGSTKHNCDYYRGWNNDTEEGSHPGGQSNLCNKDSCLMVGIHDQGAERILDVIGDTPMEWGTDGTAFSQMAYEYFTDATITTSPPIDPHSSCQLRYVIVIGDGGWKHPDESERLIRNLRTEKDVKTLVVAYGGLTMEKNETALLNFASMAIAGSCDDENSDDCEKTIMADNPQQLKTALQGKIQQIIAERLAFTAPTITATIEKGGEIYQSQFDYVQHGEWQGTVRKNIIGTDGEVDFDHADSWSASEKMYAQTKRRIWTAMPEVDYLGDWNNFTTDTKNVAGIRTLFELFGNDVIDYHRVTARTDGSTIGTRCGGEHENEIANAEVIEGTSVADGVDDDVVGLISFVRGNDFFDYDGDCVLTEKRLNMLGDIYHSQLVEVGQPNAFTSFTSTNQESYWRSKNNYQSFVTEHESREKILYAGANDGMLHAFNAGTGEEEWAFVPPFIAAKLPSIINEDLNGTVGEDKTGGSAAIFAVDGSPVIHDIFYKGIKPDGTFDTEPSWHTIMIIPYGRGGRGFSILDITHPIIETGKGPVHIVSIFNDKDNRKIWMADHEGSRKSWEYLVSDFHIRDSLEGQKARDNERKGRNASPSTIDDIYECQTNEDASGSFKTSGTNSCYKGTTFSFNPATAESFLATDLKITEGSTVLTPLVHYTVDTSCGARLCINFTTNKVVSASRSESKAEYTSSISIKITSEVIAGLANTPEYDYSTLGETWSSPRIFRLPNEGAGDIDINDDIYAAILPSGMGGASSVFIINLEDVEDGPGKIIKKIKIEDTKFEDGGSNIINAIPASPIVITSDIGHGIEWSGALAYVGDFEGKITKINLTNIEAPGIEIYDHSTLFNLNSSEENGRYLYHMMDAGIGRDTKQLWLFGGTGDFEDINGASDTMDNILFGIRDFDYPNYKHIPTPTNDVDSLVGINECVNTSLLGSAADCSVTPSNSGWVYHLDNENTLSKHRKSSATPTIYRGNVYFPVYKPFEGQDKCNLGSAYICSADDECGINTSEKIPEYAPSEAEEDACMFIRRGILSELVIFGDTLFGNVAGPDVDEQTLISILASTGDVDTYRGSWRENY